MKETEQKPLQTDVELAVTNITTNIIAISLSWRSFNHCCKTDAEKLHVNYAMSDTKEKLTCAVYSTIYNSDTLLIEETACRYGAYHHFESLYILYKYISGRRWWAKGYNWVGTPLSSQ